MNSAQKVQGVFSGVCVGVANSTITGPSSVGLAPSGKFYTLNTKNRYALGESNFLWSLNVAESIMIDMVDAAGPLLLSESNTTDAHLGLGYAFPVFTAEIGVGASAVHMRSTNSSNNGRSSIDAHFLPALKLCADIYAPPLPSMFGAFAGYIASVNYTRLTSREVQYSTTGDKLGANVTLMGLRLTKRH